MMINRPFDRLLTTLVLTRFKQMRRLFLGSYMLALPFIMFPQDKTIDSLQGLLQNARHDTTRINLNYQLSEQLAGYDLARADQYLEAGYKLAKAVDNAYYIAQYFLNKGKLLFDKAKYTECGSLFDSALRMFNGLLESKEEDDRRLADYKIGKAESLISKGMVAAKLYSYEKSIQYYLQAIPSLEDIKGNRKNVYLATLYADIASDYYELEQFENALKYDKLGLRYVDQSQNTDNYIISHLFVADDFSGLSRFDSSSAYLEKIRPLVMRLNKPNLNVRFYYILGGIQRKKGEWADALTNFQKAHDAAEKLKDDFQLLNAAEGMAASNLNLGNLSRARELALIVLNKSNEINLPLGKNQSLQLLTSIEERSGNIAKAYEYQKQWILVSDSMKKEKVQRQMQETEEKYQNEKKEKEIFQLQKSSALQTLSLQKKSTFNYFLIGSLIALLATGFLIYRNLRNRQHMAKQQDELQRQRIRELEKDRQLIAIDSMLKGQEEERSRLAKDLHDGLGGLLSGVKFSLSNMKDNLIVTPDNMAVFERSLDMLDTSIRELRRVAHNMMPEMLTKFGLDEAVKDFCSTVNATKLLLVNYRSLGMEKRMEKGTEIIIFRIIQELMNNVLKHAMATEVFVQLIREGERMSIIVEDNGKGFDIALLENSKGAGWVNIRSRVEYLKGRLDVHSDPGKGTLVNMEFNLLL